MAIITITGISLGTVPIVNQDVKVRYRLTSAPDIATSYTYVGDFPVLPNGNFITPLIISGLLGSTSYTLWVTNQCSNSSFTKPITTVANTPATVDIDVTEQSTPTYADVNTQGKDNATIIFDQNGTGSASGTVAEGDVFQLEVYSTFYPTGDSSNIHVTVDKNGINVLDENMVADPSSPHIIYTDTVAMGDVYDCTAVSTSTGSAGYVIINKTGSAIAYDIRPASGGSITSSGSIPSGDKLNLLPLLTGGSSTYINFNAPVNGDYKRSYQPTPTTDTSGAVLAGAIIYDIDIAGVTHNQTVLFYNSTVLTLLP